MIKIGTCGYGYYDPGPDWRKRYKSKLEAYASAFAVCEINSTFYALPRTETAERWRREAGPALELTIKAWQALTHPTSSRTWRRGGRGLTEPQRQHFGHLRANREVVEAWEATKVRARALRASVCLLQTPPSFGCSEVHERGMRELLTQIDRGGLRLAWEPRGSWQEHPDRVARLCADLDLIHVVDLMRREPVSEGSPAYVRLHGLADREYDYRYAYSLEELTRLAEKLRALERRCEIIYCLFNNTSMYLDASRLRELL